MLATEMRSVIIAVGTNEEGDGPTLQAAQTHKPGTWSCEWQQGWQGANFNH